MIINPYTKKAENYFVFDLCAGVDINPNVKALYQKYRGRCEQFLLTISKAKNSSHRYYVYAWYTLTDPKRYFYVGKGCGKRCNHILSDIEKVKNGKQNRRFQMYHELQNKWGIDYEIFQDKLTEYEALIYEQCKKLELLENGEVLLNIEGMPDEYLLHDWDGANSKTPILLKSPFYERYFDVCDNPHFDSIDEKRLMRVYLYPYFLDTSDASVMKDKEIMVNWLNMHGAKVYRTISTKTESVIIQGGLKHNIYLKYRELGLSVYSSKDVIAHISLQ